MIIPCIMAQEKYNNTEHKFINKDDKDNVYKDDK